MPPPPQNKLFSPHSVPPRLRPDLVITQQKYRGRTNYVIKDPIALRYYRLGPEELYLAGLLDGKRTMAEVTERMKQKFPDAGFDLAAVINTLTLFAQMSYLQLSGEQGQFLFTLLRENRRKRERKRLPLKVFTSIIYFKIPLFDPDILLLKMEKKLRFLWSRWTIWFLCALMALSVALVFWNLGRVSAGIPNFLTLHNLFILWAILVLVKVVHEFGHGLMCKHYGGEVHEMGAMFIVLTPFLYCDATDAWTFPSKWKKIAVNFGGILVELFLAGFATIVWAVTQPGFLHQLAFDVMVVCSVTTVLFNANPLMKFDGYYALADWLEVPNLRDQARQNLMGSVVRFLMGDRSPQPDKIGSRSGRTLMAVYAVASYLYIWFVVYNIVTALGARFEPVGLGGLGEMAGFITVASGMVLPIVNVAMQLRKKLTEETRQFVFSRLFRVGLIVAGVLLALWLIPLQLKVTSSCVLEGSDRQTVRAESPGFIRKLLVHEGDRIRTGDTLAELENGYIAVQLRDLEDRIQITELQKQQATALNEADAVTYYKASLAQLRAMQAKLQSETGKLVLKSPIDGIVATGDLTTRNGSYLREGELLCEMIPNGKLRVVIPLSEREASLVQAGQPVQIRIYALPSAVFQGTVTKTFLAASERLPNPALAARYGGEVPTQMDTTGHERPARNLYRAELLVDNGEHILRPGMSGRAKVLCGWSTPGRIMLSRLKDLLLLDYRI